MKLREVRDASGALCGLAFFCPGCEESHVFFLAGKLVWSFNGDREAPTFSPSLLNTWRGGRDASGRDERCHLFLTAGKIAYCGDSTHRLAGQTIDLPDHWAVENL